MLSPSRSRNCTHCLTLMEMVSISCRIQFAAKPGTTSTFAWIRNTPRRITASSVSATKISPALSPAPSNSTGGDGGGFFSGVEDNAYRSFATSWTHLFRNNLTNEFRLGYNRVNSERHQINSDKTSEQLLN